MNGCVMSFVSPRQASFVARQGLLACRGTSCALSFPHTLLNLLGSTYMCSLLHPKR